MAGKSPAFSLYARDILADCLHLSTEQFGAYCRLLFIAWIGVDGAPQGFLPSNESSYPALAGVAPPRWRKIGAPVLALFRRDDAGRVYSKRLLEELARQRQRSDAARGSAERRWHRSGAPSASKDANALRTHCDGDASDADAAADANAVSREREREGEGAGAPVDLAPYRRLLAAFYPPTRLQEALADGGWEPIDSALASAAAAGRLPAPSDFGFSLRVWALSEDWRDQGGRFVPTPERFVARRRFARRPRSTREDPGGWLTMREVAEALAGAAA